MAVSPFTQGGGFPFLTGFGPTTTPGGFSNQSFGAPGITGFGFPPPFVDPLFFFTPAASSFNINQLLGGAAGLSVPINIGPVPSTLGVGPFLLGFPFFGGGTGGQVPGGFGGGFGGGGFGGGGFGGFGGFPQQQQFGGFGGGFGGFGGFPQQQQFGGFNGFF